MTDGVVKVDRAYLSETAQNLSDLSSDLETICTAVRGLDGLVVGVANPKSIVFFAAVLPQFVEPDAGPVRPQLLVLGLIWLVIALIFDNLWGLAAGSAQSWLRRRPKRLERVGAAGGVVMIGLGVRLALTGQRH